MSLIKRKIGNTVCFMPDGEYSLCGMAFDGENETDIFNEDETLTDVRQITCDDCRSRINAVRQLLNRKQDSPA